MAPNTTSPAMRPRIGRDVFWLLLLGAAALAVKLPLAWIEYSDREAHRGYYLNFHPQFIVVYAPLAFGLLWPVLMGSAALAYWSAGQSRVWPAKISLVMFLACAIVSTPLIILERIGLNNAREAIRQETQRRVEASNQQEWKTWDAVAGLRANGVTSLAEPLTGEQVSGVNRYFDSPLVSPAEMVDAARHYRTTVDVMVHLAQKRSCPPEALEILFENALNLQKDPPPPKGFTVYQLLSFIAWHPNVPVPVLMKMLENGDSTLRSEAGANPKLTKAVRISYLKTAAVSRSVSERELAARSPDCPPEELKLLAFDPATAKDVASNPSAPVELLRSLSHSKSLETRDRALDSLVQRQAIKP